MSAVAMNYLIKTQGLIMDDRDYPCSVIPDALRCWVFHLTPTLDYASAAAGIAPSRDGTFRKGWSAMRLRNLHRHHRRREVGPRGPAAGPSRMRGWMAGCDRDEPCPACRQSKRHRRKCGCHSLCLVPSRFWMV